MTKDQQIIEKAIASAVIQIKEQMINDVETMEDLKSLRNTLDALTLILGELELAYAPDLARIPSKQMGELYNITTPQE